MSQGKNRSHHEHTAVRTDDRTCTQIILARPRNAFQPQYMRNRVDHAVLVPISHVVPGFDRRRDVILKLDRGPTLRRRPRPPWGRGPTLRRRRRDVAG